LDIQDESGAWTQGLSNLTTAQLHTYNIRAAWGMARFGKQVGNDSAIEGAIRNAEWVSGQQEENGWFHHMAFNAGEPPLTHTIAYTIQGLMEIGALTGHAEYVGRAAEAARMVFSKQNPVTGSLPGQFHEGWEPVPGWTS